MSDVQMDCKAGDLEFKYSNGHTKSIIEAYNVQYLKDFKDAKIYITCQEVIANIVAAV